MEFFFVDLFAIPNGRVKASDYFIQGKQNQLCGTNVRKVYLGPQRRYQRLHFQLQFLKDDALLEADLLSDIFPHPEPVKKALHILIRAPQVGECSLPIAYSS